VCSAGPADPKIGRSRRNWKFPLVMHSIGVSLVVQKRCARVRPVRLRSAIEGRAVLGVSGGAGRHEGAFRDHPFFHRVATLRKRHAPAAIRWPDGSWGTSVWSRARRLLVGDCEHAVAEGHFKPAHCWIVPDTAAASGASRVSGRTATDCGFAVRSADLLFRDGGLRPAALCLRAVALGHCDRARLRVNCMPPNIIPCFTARTEDLSQRALLEHSRRALKAE